MKKIINSILLCTLLGTSYPNLRATKTDTQSSNTTEATNNHKQQTKSGKKSYTAPALISTTLLAAAAIPLSIFGYKKYHSKPTPAAKHAATALTSASLASGSPMPQGPTADLPSAESIKSLTFSQIADLVQKKVDADQYPDYHTDYLEVQAGDQVFVIGDIHGDIEGLGKILREIGINPEGINPDLKIPDGMYLIFLGDYGTLTPDERAPVGPGRIIHGPGDAPINESVNVLNLLLKLKLINDRKVFLLRGNWEAAFFEQDDVWVMHAFIGENALCAFDNDAINARGKAVGKFFPVALYLRQNHDIVQVSHGAGILNREETEAGFMPVPAHFSKHKEITHDEAWPLIWNDFSVSHFTRTNIAPDNVLRYITKFNQSLNPYQLRAFFSGHMHLGAPLKMFAADGMQADEAAELGKVGMVSYSAHLGNQKKPFTMQEILQNGACPVFIFNATKMCLYASWLGTFLDKFPEAYSYAYTHIQIGDGFDNWTVTQHSFR